MAEIPVTGAGAAQSIIRDRTAGTGRGAPNVPAARCVQLICRGSAVRASASGFSGTAPPFAAEDRTSIHSLIHVPERGGGRPTGLPGAVPGRAMHLASGT